MKYDSEFIGNTIRLEREKRRWNQKDLGKRLGVSGKQVSKYEHGDPIPPIDVLFKLCDVFECELGYLLGEKSYSEGTKLQTAICESLNLSISSTEAITKITGTDRSCLSFGHQSQKYKRIINNLLSSPMFPGFVEALGDLDDRITECNSEFVSIEKKYGKELYEEASRIYYSSTDYEHDSDSESLSPEVCEVIREISHAEDQCYGLSYFIKVARYELRESFEELMDGLYPRK